MSAERVGVEEGEEVNREARSRPPAAALYKTRLRSA